MFAHLQLYIHCQSSQTTQRLRFLEASLLIILYCVSLVSWYSSTRKYENLACICASTWGISSISEVFQSISSKSRQFMLLRRFSYSAKISLTLSSKYDFTFSAYIFASYQLFLALEIAYVTFLEESSLESIFFSSRISFISLSLSSSSIIEKFLEYQIFSI